MTDHKFTGDEIIKMLEEISEVGNCSRDCIFYDGKVHSCKDVIAHYALIVINSQKAEIERLNKEVDRLSQCVLYHDGIVSDLEKDVFNAKAEAIKEFAERLKEKAKANEWNGTICGVEIDTLEKEMTEEQK